MAIYLYCALTGLVTAVLSAVCFSWLVDRRGQQRAEKAAMDAVRKLMGDNHPPCPAPAAEVAERSTVIPAAPFAPSLTGNRVFEGPGAPPELWSQPSKARLVDISKDERSTLYLRIGSATLVSSEERETPRDTPTQPSVGVDPPRPLRGPRPRR